MATFREMAAHMALYTFMFFLYQYLIFGHLDFQDGTLVLNS